MADNSLAILNAVDLGTRLRAERRALGLTQSTLAERVRLSRQTIIDAEAGKNISLYVLMALLAGLGKGLQVTDARPALEDLQQMFSDEEAADVEDQNTSGANAPRPRG